MVIHPPVMFAGFASLSVPFAFAIAALWTKPLGRLGSPSHALGALHSGDFGHRHTHGRLLGLQDSRMGRLLGVGPRRKHVSRSMADHRGSRAWNVPAEDALQTPQDQHRPGHPGFCCILYGTFLTRSGVLADFSVHSFVDLGITGWLVGIISVFFFGGLGLFAYRWREIPREMNIDPETGKEKDEPFLSRSVLFILSVTLFCASAIVILLGTSAPILTGLVSKPSQVATSFYNITHTPIAVLIALLIALVPFVSWRGETWGSIGRKAFLSMGMGILGAGIGLAAGVRNPKDLLIFGLSAFALASSTETIILFIKRKAIRTMGGYLAHAGASIMLTGIIVSGVYEEKTQVTLPRGEPMQVGRNTMTFTRTVFVTEDGGVKQFGELDTGKTLRPPRQTGDGGRGEVAQRKSLEGLSEDVSEREDSAV